MTRAQWVASLWLGLFGVCGVACGSKGGSSDDSTGGTGASSGTGGDSNQPPGGGGSTGVDPSCTPGDVESCTCPAPATGQHLCDSTGHFGACLCITPAGSLVCGGKSCRGGGTCNADGSCPAFLGDCFHQSNGFATCNQACSAQGFTCAQSSCSPDGTGDTGGYTWVSYAAADPNACTSYGANGPVSLDQCVTPIWLSPTVPTDNAIRCCCRAP